MGLFNWLKKENGLDSMSKGLAKSNSATNLDDLMAAAKENRPAAMEALWNAIFGLTHWHFVVKGQPDPTAGGKVALFCVVAEQRPLLCGFTSEERANEFGAKRGFEEGFAIVTTAMPAAIATALQYEGQGVVGVIFDENVGGGAFAAMPNLVGLYGVRESIGLVEAAERCGVDPAKPLEDRFAILQSSQHLHEFVDWACDRPAWWVLADPANPDRPRVWPEALEGKQTAAIFTSEARAREDAAKVRSISASGGPLFLQYPRAEYSRLIERLRYEAGVDVIVLNMRVPVASKGLSDLIAARSK